jgi:two-component system LytT family response regulator
MVRALIIDDEELSRHTLRNMLELYCPAVSVVGLGSNAPQARDLIVRHNPDVVFLDIEMPEESGFDLLASIHPDHRNFAVIFVTAYDQYALRAIKASAIDYLLKPIDLDELRTAVDKLIEQSAHRPAAREMNRASMQTVLDNVRPARTVNRVALPTAQGLRIVTATDIVHCEGDNNYTSVHLVSGDRVVVCRTIKEFEYILGGTDFVRIHKSHLVNVRHVRSYQRELERDSGGHLVLSNGERVEVSRRRKDDLMKRFQVKVKPKNGGGKSEDGEGEK